MSEWIVIPNWDKFQHYKDREPVWIKLYLELRSADEWRHLTLTERGLLVSIWMEFGAARGVLRASDLPSRVAQKSLRRSLNSLKEAGFIELVASKPLALARSREAYRSKEETPKPPFRKSEPRKARVTGWRMVRGSHGITYVPDPNGTDKPEADARL